MSYFITGSGLITVYGKLADNSATAVLTAVSATTVVSIVCTENAGATPNLTIAVFDPSGATVTYYLRNAVAMTAKQTVTYSEPIVLNPGWSIHVTSSSVTGGVDVLVNHFNANATGRSS